MVRIPEPQLFVQSDGLRVGGQDLQEGRAGSCALAPAQEAAAKLPRQTPAPMAWLGGDVEQAQQIAHHYTKPAGHRGLVVCLDGEGGRVLDAVQDAQMGVFDDNYLGRLTTTMLAG